jgi:very-short-patch-repair endonuclease
MEIDQALRRLGGVATHAQLVCVTSRSAVRRALRRGAVVRDARGRYALPVTAEALRTANALTGVVSHRSAALHRGWQVKLAPPKPEVTVRRKRHLRQGQRDLATVHWADLEPHEVEGLVTSVERTLVDCLRTLPFDEALAIADSALRQGAVSKRRLVAVADGVRGAGAAQVRRVADHASNLAANPFESVLRAIALDVEGLDLQPQLTIRDADGHGRPDLVDRTRRLVVEAESHSWHSRRGALRRDCRRYTKLVLLGWRVLRFAWEDVMHHPDYVRACLERAVADADRQAEPPSRRRRAA